MIGHAVDAARRVSRRRGAGAPDPSRDGRARCARSRRTPRRCSSPSATRFRRRSCAGTAAGASSASSAISTHDVKSAAPQSLLTYVNFPPTEYLDLDVFDVCAFNVYLHREPDLRAYLARLQHLAGRPAAAARRSRRRQHPRGRGRPGRASPRRTSARRSPRAPAAPSPSRGPTSGGAAGTTVRRLGVRPGRRRAAAEAGARGGAARRSPTRRSRRRTRRLAQGVGGRLRLQRRRHHRRLPHVARRAHLPALRDHRRQRRLARRHRARVRAATRACASSTSPTAA